MNGYRIASQNYVYLGYAVTNLDDVQRLVSALKNRNNLDLSDDIHVAKGTLYRLRPDVEKLLANDPKNETELEYLRHSIPVMFEMIHRQHGNPCDSMHVLYLDGHIDQITIGDRFPATQEVIDALLR